ncbi:MAG: DUF2726 domain-containing protein [Aquisalimonadaceae bacterium]
MSSWTPLITIAVALTALFLFIRATAPRGTNPHDEYRLYHPRESLLTPVERAFLDVLDQAAGGYRVFAKVRIGDLVTPRQGLARAVRRRVLNRVAAAHVDYVICETDRLMPVAVVELDGGSADGADSPAREELLDAVFGAVGLPLLRFPAQYGYLVEDVRKRLAVVLFPDQQDDEDAAREAHAPVASPVHVKSPPQPATPSCPKCNGTMIRRQVRKGARAGTWFWTCRRFPACRGVVPVIARGAGHR